MAAQVRGDHVVAVAQALGDPVPVAAVVPAAVNQQQGRRAFVSPVDVVQSNPLRKIEVGRGAFHGALRKTGAGLSIHAADLATIVGRSRFELAPAI